MPDHRLDLVLVDETIGDGNGLLRFAGVVTLHQFNLLAVDAARRVDVGDVGGHAAEHLLAKGRIGAGKGLATPILIVSAAKALENSKAEATAVALRSVDMDFMCFSLWLKLFDF